MSEPTSAEAVFCEALEKEPVERVAFLERACAGNESLRREVQSLLDAHQQAGQFLERPVVEADGLAAAEATDHGDALPPLAPSSRPGSLGRLDHYEVLEVVGKGGTGVVLRARDDKLERVVALKVLAAPLAASGTARQRFAREARAAAAIRDERVIDIHAVRDDAPIPYLVMEFIDGCNLEALIRQGGPLEVKEVLRIGIQVAGGLAAAHKMGLIHRDVKPANILLENGVQRVKLTDFGLARAADDASLTQSGFIAGTPTYMSPEQANGEPIDHRSDLFSLGSVLYEICTGRPAFRAPNTAAVLRRVSDETPRPIREINPDVPATLCRVIERLQAKKPADRPASAQEVADLLARLLAAQQGQVSGTPVVDAVRPPQTSRRALHSRLGRWAAAALVLLVIGLGLSEATGVTDVRGIVIRLFAPDGTLVVEVDDPGVSVTVDGGDVVITGAGAREIRLKPGNYQVQASKDGKVVRQQLVTVTRDGRQVVRISKEPEPAAEVVSPDADWEKFVAALPADKQVHSVAKQLMGRNPGFNGHVERTMRDGVVIGLRFNTDNVSDLSPVRALTRLELLDCIGSQDRKGKVVDLSPLRGLPLKRLIVSENHVTDLSPLAGMPLEMLSVRRNVAVKTLAPLKGLPLRYLDCAHTCVPDLAPLKGMKLTELRCEQSLVTDVTPLAGMPLKYLSIAYTQVADLKPLRGMPLETLLMVETPVEDLTPLRGMPLTRLKLTFRPEREAALLRSLTTLQEINEKSAAAFWKEVDGK